jgi:uncharacterized protein YkwD
MRLHQRCALAVLTVAAACAGPSQGGQGTSSGAAASAAAGGAAAPAPTAAPGAAGAFAPSRPPNPQYGSSAGYSCPGGGVMDELKTALGELSRDGKRTAPAADPRLCAAAEAFLSWKDPAALPPESVSSFASWYFGSPTPSLRILGAVLETDDARVIAERLVHPLSQFAASATAPRFGVVTQTTTSGDRRAGAASRKVRTRLVLAMQDAGVELTQPVPRQLPAGGTAGLEGKVLADVARTTVLVGDPSGKLETIGPKDGKAFAADLKCGARPGVLLVEVRGEQSGGGATAAARFPVGCGVELPRSTPIPTEGGTVDTAAAERKLLDGVNALRASAGLAPLALEEAVARVARDASQAQSRATGSTVDFDVSGALAKAEVPSPLVLLNPAAAFTPDEAHWRLTTSPVHRSNMLNPQATHAGVGVTAQREGNEGVGVYYVTELFVRELPPIDAEAMRAKLREGVTARRRDARADPVKPDPLLEDVAQKYASALAAGKGAPPEQTLNDVVAPLYKAMRVVSITSGTKLDPLEAVEEPGVASAGKVFGVGVAQGFSTNYGKNTVYVAIIVGSRK